MTYTEFRTALIQMLVVTDVYGQQMFDALLPRIIEYAELRCYRAPELDFLSTRTTDTSQTTTTGSRSMPLPAQFVVVENVNLITPANATLNTAGYQRVPLLRTSRSFIDATWPDESQTATPAPFEVYWALYSQQETAGESDFGIPNRIIISPTPDNQYVAEILGTFRPDPLTEGNPETYLTIYTPDLFLSAAMVVACGGLLKNYGAQADDPKMALSWEALFQDQLHSSGIQSLRQKALVEGVSSQPPNQTRPDVSALQAAAAAAPPQQ